MKDLIALAAARTRLGVGRKALLALVRQGKLPALKVGQEWRFDPDDIAAFVDREKQRAAPTTRPATATVARSRGRSAQVDWKGADRYLTA